MSITVVCQRAFDNRRPLSVRDVSSPLADAPPRAASRACACARARLAVPLPFDRSLRHQSSASSSWLNRDRLPADKRGSRDVSLHGPALLSRYSESTARRRERGELFAMVSAGEDVRANEVSKSAPLAEQHGQS